MKIDFAFFKFAHKAIKSLKDYSTVFHLHKKN